MKTKCAMCGDEIIYIDIRNKPKTCGKKICRVNFEYRKKRMNPLTGEYPDPDEIRKL